MKFPQNNDNDILLANRTEDGLMKSAKVLQSRGHKAYTPVYKDTMTLDRFDDRGDLVGQETHDVYCMQFISGKQS